VDARLLWAIAILCLPLAWVEVAGTVQMVLLKTPRKSALYCQISALHIVSEGMQMIQ